MSGNAIITMKFNTASDEMIATFSNTPVIISNDKFMLVEEIVKQVSSMSVGDVISVGLVYEPDEVELKMIQQRKEDALEDALMEDVFDFDD